MTHRHNDIHFKRKFDEYFFGFFYSKNDICSLIFANEIPDQRAKEKKLFTTQLKALSINVI